MFKSGLAFLSAALLFTACTGGEVATSDRAQHALAQAKGAILRADGPEALRLFSEIGDETLSAEHKDFLACATERLTGTDLSLSPDVSSPVVTEILPIFRAYWQDAMMNGADHAQAERDLGQRLTELLEIDHPGLIEQTIAARLQSEGLYVLMGRTGRLRDLMIWKDQRQKDQTVTLPDDEVSTTVFYLDQFISTGWSSYFACDTIGTGGWAKPEGLYVVVPRWDSLDDDQFRVSFLAHESQHFQDYARFPDLVSWELEYRAKLVELALAEDDQPRLIEMFATNQGDDQADAHSYANRKILTDLRTYLDVAEDDALGFGSVATVQQAAISLLKRDTQTRQTEVVHD